MLSNKNASNKTTTEKMILNYKKEVIEIVKNNPEISTEMIVFKAETLKFEDQFEKNKRIRNAMFRCAREKIIKKISLNPTKWVFILQQ